MYSFPFDAGDADGSSGAAVYESDGDDPLGSKALLGKVMMCQQGLYRVMGISDGGMQRIREAAATGVLRPHGLTGTDSNNNMRKRKYTHGASMYSAGGGVDDDETAKATTSEGVEMEITERANDCTIKHRKMQRTMANTDEEKVALREGNIAGEGYLTIEGGGDAASRGEDTNNISNDADDAAIGAEQAMGADDDDDATVTTSADGGEEEMVMGGDEVFADGMDEMVRGIGTTRDDATFDADNMKPIPNVMRNADAATGTTFDNASTTNDVLDANATSNSSREDQAAAVTNLDNSQMSSIGGRTMEVDYDAGDEDAGGSGAVDGEDDDANSVSSTKSYYRVLCMRLTFALEKKNVMELQLRIQNKRLEEEIAELRR